MRNVSPHVFMIARSFVVKENVRAWLDSLGATDYEIPEGDTDGELLIKLAAKRCYLSFGVGLNPNIARTREDTVEYIDNILESRHGSVLEHVNYTFAIESVSRVFTAEMNRHRAGTAISEGSLRFIRFTDIPWWIPGTMMPTEQDSSDIQERKALTLQIFIEAFRHQESLYRRLEDIWDLKGDAVNIYAFAVKKKLTSLFRRIVGMGVATGGVWTGNIRALRHILTARLDSAAEEEIILVARLILEQMMIAEPILFGDFAQDKEGNWAPKYRKV